MRLPEVMPAKRPDVLTADFETELVVLVPERRTAHRLDEGLSLVLDACDGTTATADVVAEIVSGTGQDRGAVCRWLDDGLGQLADLGVLNVGARAEESDEPM